MTPDISPRKRAFDSLDRLRGRAQMLEAVVPKSIGGSPAFDAFLHALVRPLTSYIEWAGELLTEEDRAAGGSPDDRADGQGATRTGTTQGEQHHDPSSATAILADSERLIAAVDAFVANPLADDVRSGLVSLLNEVLTPALASAQRPPVMARPIAAAPVAVQPKASPSKVNPATDKPAKRDSPNPDPPDADLRDPNRPNNDPRNASDQDNTPAPTQFVNPIEQEQVNARVLPTHSHPRHAVEKRTDDG